MISSLLTKNGQEKYVIKFMNQELIWLGLAQTVFALKVLMMNFLNLYVDQDAIVFLLDLSLEVTKY